MYQKNVYTQVLAHKSLLYSVISLSKSKLTVSFSPFVLIFVMSTCASVVCKLLLRKTCVLQLQTCYIHTYHRSGNFRCKNIFVVCANNEKNIYILQRIIIIARTFLFTHFTAQLASYFAQDGLFDSSMSLELMPNAKQLFVRSVFKKSSVFTATVRAYGVIGFPFAR